MGDGAKQPDRSAPPSAASADSSGPRLREPSLEIFLDADGTSTPRDSLPAELPALRRFAGYELLGRIAVGGMAEVFVARERAEAGGTRHVAVKVIRAQLEDDPSFAEMFLREGKVTLGLRHPNVCHTYRFGIEGTHPYLVMELVSGISLRELIQRARKRGVAIPPSIAAKIASTVAEALHSAHRATDERGRPLEVVHQDVSPHNVMVAYDGTVKLLDFGVAQTSLEKAESTEAAETSHTTIRGKIAYLSPEQCSGAPIDARADVFSLGTVLHEMLTNQRLYKRDQTLDTLRAIALEPLGASSLSGVPEPLTRVLHRAMEKAPANRYPSAAEMQEDLEGFLAEQKIVVTSARISKFLAELMGADFGRPPKLDTRPEAVSWMRGDPTAAPFPLVSPKTPAARSRTGLVVVIAALGLALAAAIGFAVAGGSEPAVASVPPPVAALPEPSPAIAVELPPPTEAAAAPTIVVAPAEVVPVALPAPVAPIAEPRPPTDRQRRRAVTRTAPGGFIDDPGF